MANTIRTRAGCLAEAPDNTLRLISPQDYRDFVVSAFGAQLPSDPTPQDDAFNTAGNGFFDVGSVWINTIAKTLWRCFAGDHNAADWRQIWPPAAALPPARVVTELGVLFDVGLFGDNPLGGVWTVYPGEVITLMNQTNKIQNGPWTVRHAADWDRPPWFADGATIPGTQLIFARTLTIMDSAKDVAIFLVPFTGDDQTPFVVGTDQIDIQYADPEVSVTAGTGIGVSLDTSAPGKNKYEVQATSTPVTVAPGTNVSVVEAPTGTFTVSVSTFPYASLSGAPTLPTVISSDGSVSVDNTGYPVIDLSVMSTINAAWIQAGTFGAGVLIPYTQVTGTPAPGVGTIVVDVNLVATPATWTTIFDSGLQTGPVWWSFVFTNNGPNNLQIRATLTDLAGNTNTFGPFTLIPNQQDQIDPTGVSNWLGLNRAIARYVYQVQQAGGAASTYSMQARAIF